MYLRDPTGNLLEVDRPGIDALDRSLFAEAVTRETNGSDWASAPGGSWTRSPETTASEAYPSGGSVDRHGTTQGSAEAESGVDSTGSWLARYPSSVAVTSVTA